jgi:hypothetical protein
MSSLAHPNLFWRLSNKWMHLVVWVCHGRFHDILPKEYSGTFCEVPWGLYKKMITNTQGQSDIVTHQTNFWNKIIYCAKWISFHSIKVNEKKVQKLHFESQFPARLSSSWRRGEQTRPRGLSSCTFNNKWVSIIKLHWHHRHLRNIDCIMACTACLVSFTSIVNGHSKKKGLKMWH